MTYKIRGLSIYSLAKTFLLLFALFPIIAFAEGGEKKFDAGKMIVEHVSDAHSWHIAGNYTIHLPVIIYSTDKGFFLFSSARFEDGVIYNGFKLNGQKIIAVHPDGSVNNEETAKIWDISLTKNAISILLAGILMALVFTAAAKGYAKRPNQAPKGIQSAIEPVILFIRDDVAIPSIGKKKYEKYMPYLLTLFFFIIFLNLLGLIPIFPGGANVTGNIGVTTTLACFTFIITMFSSNKSYWAHTLWMPGIHPVIKLLILTPIEILGIILKPFTLLIRIFANILAGHIVALSFFSLIFIFGTLWGKAVGYSVSVFSVAFAGGMLLLDILVALIQAYVFTLLSALYFGTVTAEEEHH